MRLMGRDPFWCSKFHFRTSIVSIFLCVSCHKLQIYYKIDFACYADDNTQNVIGNGVKEAINSLKEASDNYFTGLQTIK